VVDGCLPKEKSGADRPTFLTESEMITIHQEVFVSLPENHIGLPV
jgi:hypothetical protein